MHCYKLSVCPCVFREDKLICSHGEELHSQDVHLPVLHSLLLTLLCGLLPGQVTICCFLSLFVHLVAVCLSLIVHPHVSLSVYYCLCL